MGLLPGDPTHRGAFFAKKYPRLRKNLPYEWGGGGGGETEDGTIYIYNSMVIIILLYVCDIQSSDARVSWRFEMVNGLCQFELAFVLSPVIQGRSAVTNSAPSPSPRGRQAHRLDATTPSPSPRRAPSAPWHHL